jgi:hypothetical protein
VKIAFLAGFEEISCDFLIWPSGYAGSFSDQKENEGFSSTASRK